MTIKLQFEQEIALFSWFVHFKGMYLPNPYGQDGTQNQFLNKV